MDLLVKNVIQKEKEAHYQEVKFREDMIGGKINDRNNIRLGK